MNSNASARCLDMINELKSILKAYDKLESAWFSTEKKTDEYLAASCFFENMTYRLTDSDKRDPLIGFRMAKRLIGRIYSKKDDSIQILNPEATNVVLGGILRTKDVIINYIRRCSKEPVKAYIAKDFISASGQKKFPLLLALLPFMLRQSFRSIFSSRRLNLALSIHEVFEIAFLLHFFRTQNINHVYDWIPYEKDSNFLSLLLMKEGIAVTKIPSPGPLATHNRIMIGSEVILSTPYHFEELKKFQDSIRTGKVTKWPPQGAEAHITQYLNHPETPQFSIGFYSHGSWVRKEERHSQHGREVDVAELKILSFLGKFVVENPQYSLVIFPHPREKKKDVTERTRKFYTEAIGHDHFKFVPDGLSTVSSFHLADIAIGAFSSILYERMYCGYKTLIGNIGFYDFPMNGSTLNNISFVTYEGMKKLIEEFAQHDEAYYFQRTNLDEYRYLHYQVNE